MIKTKSIIVKGKLLIYLYFDVDSDGTTDESVFVRGNRMENRTDEKIIARMIRQEVEHQGCQIQYNKI